MLIGLFTRAYEIFQKGSRRGAVDSAERVNKFQEKCLSRQKNYAKKQHWLAATKGEPRKFEDDAKEAICVFACGDKTKKSCGLPSWSQNVSESSHAKRNSRAIITSQK